MPSEDSLLEACKQYTAEAKIIYIDWEIYDFDELVVGSLHVAAKEAIKEFNRLQREGYTITKVAPKPMKG